jgi:hypothetical protein
VAKIILSLHYERENFIGILTRYIWVTTVNILTRYIWVVQEYRYSI